MPGHVLSKLHYHKKIKTPGHVNSGYDKFMYFIGMFAWVTNLPQLITIITNKTAAGVSTLSWFLFFGISTTWAIYAIKHKEISLLLMNALYAAIQLTIAIYSIIY